MADFETWSQENLAKFAHDCWEENMQLREDRRILLNQLRQLIKENDKLQALVPPYQQLLSS